MVALPSIFALEPRYKEQYAAFLLRGFSPFIAGMQLFPNDPGMADTVSRQWPEDPYVVACMTRAREDEAKKNALPTKHAQIKRIEEKLSGPIRFEDYLKAERLIAEMSGHIEKAAPPSITVNANQQVVERVMVVKDHGTDEQWEEKARAQQAKLIEAT